MKSTQVSQLLAIQHPVLQAGLPWVSKPELVAAVSNAGGLGVLHPTAGADSDSDLVANLKATIRRTKGLTRKPFAAALDLPSPQIEALIEGAVHEGVHTAVTYGGSPALYTGTLKDHRMKVLRQLTTVRHARGAKTQGVDIVIASGSIVDSRGYIAAIALGAQGVQMGSRFVAAAECISHQRYKEAIVAAIDSGTTILVGDRWPTRVLRDGVALRLKDEGLHEGLQGAEPDLSAWEAEFGAAMMDGDLESGIVYTGVNSGLTSEILTVHQFFEELEQGTQSLGRKLA